MKICTSIDDEIFLEAREAYEHEEGRWKRGSLKELFETSLRLYAKKHEKKG